MTQSVSYDGITIDVKVSSVREFEAALAGVSVDEANQRLLKAMERQVEMRYPGAIVNVEVSGDEPKASVSGTENTRLIQAITYAVQHTGLKLKWDISQGTLP